MKYLLAFLLLALVAHCSHAQSRHMITHSTGTESYEQPPAELAALEALALADSITWAVAIEAFPALKPVKTDTLTCLWLTYACTDGFVRYAEGVHLIAHYRGHLVEYLPLGLPKFVRVIAIQEDPAKPLKLR